METIVLKSWNDKNLEVMEWCISLPQRKKLHLVVDFILG
jgi:hypothetical protein